MAKSIFAVLSLLMAEIPLPTTAATIPAPETAYGGGLFLLNNVYGTVSYCLIVVNGYRGCRTVTTFYNVTANTRIVSTAGGNTYIVEPSTGQTMACYATLGIAGPIPTCVTLAAKL